MDNFSPYINVDISQSVENFKNELVTIYPHLEKLFAAAVWRIARGEKDFYIYTKDCYLVKLVDKHGIQKDNNTLIVINIIAMRFFDFNNKLEIVSK